MASTRISISGSSAILSRSLVRTPSSTAKLRGFARSRTPTRLDFYRQVLLFQSILDQTNESAPRGTCAQYSNRQILHHKIRVVGLKVVRFALWHANHSLNLNVVFPNLPLQRGTGDPEQLTDPSPVATGEFERVQDMLFFHVVKQFYG